MLIYLASPYTPTPEQIAALVAECDCGLTDACVFSAGLKIKRERFDAAVAAVAELMRAGAHVLSPIASSHPVSLAHDLPGGYAYWQALDRELIDACAEVWVLCLPGFDESVGIADETAYALEHGKVVRYLDPEDVTAPLRDAVTL
jgi:hypothetical protein